MKVLVGVAIGMVLLLAAPFVVVLIVVAGIGVGPPPVSAHCATEANLATILATIRTLESGGNYTIESAGGSTASGAYQFLDSSWNNYGGYQRARDAPPDVQDQKAADLVRSVLAEHAGDVNAVPVTWYIGDVPGANSPEWDTIPYPENGNRLTPANT